MSRLVTILVTLFVAVMLISSTVYVVDQRSYAIVFSFGKMVGDEIRTPGLHFKLPPPFQNVIYLDKRIHTLDTPDAVQFMTAEKKNIMVDAFVKWNIADPKRYYVSFGGDSARANTRMEQIIKNALNEEITKRTVLEVISTQRSAVMDAIRTKVIAESKQIGVQIIDVRLKRVDYSDQISSSVFERMKAERTRVANEARSTGSAESETIRADADRQRTVLLANAFREAERIKGEGDAKASAIYAESFGKNPEFARFYRSLEAYRASFSNRNDVMVVDPNSEFFKYFRSPGGASAAAPKK